MGFYIPQVGRIKRGGHPPAPVWQGDDVAFLFSSDLDTRQIAVVLGITEARAEQLLHVSQDERHGFATTPPAAQPV